MSEANQSKEQDTPSASSNSNKHQLPLQAVNNEIIPVTQFPPLSVFEQATHYPALIVPVRRTAELRNSLKGALLHLPKIKNVYNTDNMETRKLVLSGEDALQDERVQKLLKEDHCPQSSHTIALSYQDLSVEQVLRQVLPPSISELPAAFEIVGRIAHLNLRDELLAYKFLVGKVILDKNQPRIQTVVNKLGSIANEYRTFGMEVIAGNAQPNWSLVTVKEEGCEFALDFQHVYWNSRLGMEHKRLVQQIRQDAQQRQPQPTIVADLMAGVGPFAVPLTARLPDKQHNKKHKKKNKGKDIPPPSNNSAKIIVHANDLNPASYKYLQINADKNKCSGLMGYNMDARAFCHKLQNDNIEFHHVIMNLPATAPEFLDAFRGFSNKVLPRIHVYCFAAKPEEDQQYEKQVMERCSAALGCNLEVNQVQVRIVRDVSPKKNMVCVSFDLPEQVRPLPHIKVEPRIGGAKDDGEEVRPDDNDGGEPPKPKRCKTSEES